MTTPTITVTPTPLVAGSKVTISIADGVPGQTSTLTITNGTDKQTIEVTYDEGGSASVEWDAPHWTDCTLEIDGASDGHVIISP